MLDYVIFYDIAPALLGRQQTHQKVDLSVPFLNLCFAILPSVKNGSLQ